MSAAVEQDAVSGIMVPPLDPAQRSPAQALVAELAQLGAGAHGALDAMLDAMGTTELAGLYYDWRDFWARPKQLLGDGPWRSWGFLTGRGYGKTRAIAEWIVSEVMAGRATRIALIAQNEEKTHEVMVDGKSGLIACSPPWFRPEMIKGRLVWPNGAQAFVYTPEVPGALRGPEHDLAWASEFVAWPTATREEAFSNLRLGLRIGYGRLVWDSTPKRRHPMIRWLLDRAKRRPRHVVVSGVSFENADNITEELLQEWIDEFGGTQQGREELYGEYFDESSGAPWQQTWIDRSRRDMPEPEMIRRRIISIDPAITTNKGSDRTGIVDLALGTDAQVYIVANLTGKHKWEAWPRLAIERYLSRRCDCIVVETNRGGEAVAANLRAVAREWKDADDKPAPIEVVVVAKKAPTRHDPRTIYVKEVKASISKTDRHQPVATMYERGRVSHVVGGPGLEGDEGLESWLTTWEPVPGKKSPDAIDAVVQGVDELADLSAVVVDKRAGYRGMAQVTAAIMARQPASPIVSPTPTRTGSTLASVLGRSRSEWGGRF